MLPHELKCDAQVVAEVEVVQHVDDVVTAVLVLLPQMVQYPDFHQGLVMEPLLVPDDLDRHVLVGHVVERLYHLAEAALSDHLEDLVSITDVIMQHLRQI